MANISIPLEMAERIIDLYTNIEAADAHFQRCQSDNFRLHVQAVYRNAGVSAAFEDLKQQIDAQKASAPEKPANARRGVLTSE